MAIDKKSFVLYADILHTVKHLSREQAGDLFMHLLEYVNDKNPETENPIVNIAFEPIKQSLKRDLKRWETKQQQRSEAGRLGGLARAEKAKQKEDIQANQATATIPKQTQANQAVSVSGSVSVSEINSKTTIYTKKEFVEDWNRIRTKHLKKPSFLPGINGEDESNFKELLGYASKEDIQNALIGLFKQKKFPNGNTQMASNPKHFLTHFNSYLSAFHDQNENLYGIKELEKTI